MQVKKSDTGRIYAMKTISKAHIVDRNEITHTLAERMVLERVNCPFIVPLKFSFQSKQKLYLVLAFVNGGELFHHLQQEQRFGEERSRFYSAELLLALEHLHTLDVVYRDLKPENILLDYNGHIALCDFGLCKVNMKDGNRTNTFCGTPEYLAPEILNGHGYGQACPIVFAEHWADARHRPDDRLVDARHPPVRDDGGPASVLRRAHRQDVREDPTRPFLPLAPPTPSLSDSAQDPLTFPEDFSDEACSILTGLITRDPAQRLGRQGAEAIKAHPFFAKHIDFGALVQKKIQPPFKPRVTSPVDVSNFDAEFTAEPPMDSYKEGPQLSQTVQDQFYGARRRGPRGAATTLTAPRLLVQRREQHDVCLSSPACFLHFPDTPGSPPSARHLMSRPIIVARSRFRCCPIASSTTNTVCMCVIPSPSAGSRRGCPRRRRARARASPVHRTRARPRGPRP
jgi:serum/glucocorticoid-regulated kinase 2